MSVMPSYLDRVVVRSGDQHPVVARVEGHRIDHVCVRVLGQTHAVVSVPQVAVLVFRTTKYISLMEVIYLLHQKQKLIQ